MAGMKGRSGGPRPNSGGARPGAGRPKGSKNTKAAAPEHETTQQASAPDRAAPVRQSALEYLQTVVNDASMDVRVRVRAAIAAAQYESIKKGDGGKKDEQDAAAKKAASGKFAPKAPPKLVVNNRG